MPDRTQYIKVLIKFCDGFTYFIIQYHHIKKSACLAIFLMINYFWVTGWPTSYRGKWFRYRTNQIRYDLNEASKS